MSKSAFRVIDLFAGPGGLAEGFSSVLDDEGNRSFEIALSAEKEASAHQTLTLRAFTRQFEPGRVPDEYYALCEQRLTLAELAMRHPKEWAAAQAEAMLIELGTPAGDSWMDERISALLKKGGRDPGRRYVVIG